MHNGTQIEISRLGIIYVIHGVQLLLFFLLPLFLLPFHVFLSSSPDVASLKPRLICSTVPCPNLFISASWFCTQLFILFHVGL